MTVRRLATEDLQPEGFAFSGANAEWAERTIAKFPAGRQASAVIPLLMRAQEQEGWVTRSAIEHVADMLDMPYIRVLEVATFYTQFQLKPVGTHAHVQVCGTTPCMLRGAEDLIAVCRNKIHPEPFHTNDEGTLSWEEVECLGACVNAPMVMIFKDTYEDLTPERLEEIIDEFEAGRGEAVPPGPQNGRFHSSPITGFTALSDENAVLKTTRDREIAAARAAAEETPAQGDADVAPSQAAKPKTDAPETNPAIVSPSKEKASPAAEAALSVEPPRTSKRQADRTAPESEGEARPRAPSGQRSAEAPRLDDADRPASIERPAVPDELQLIAGIGPKNERLLHELGIYTFAQIAAWKTPEREWVDAYLRFKGRIEREEWVGQASALAAGGEAEYIRVFGKKPR